jgi:hypothetical protein
VHALAGAVAAAQAVDPSVRGDPSTLVR